MRARRVGVVVAAAIAATLLVASCQTTPPVVYTPPECPYADNVIQFNGDSLGIHIPRYISAPPRTLANRSEPRSGFTYELAYEPERDLPPVPSIGESVKQWIDECGAPNLVIIQGGINDLAGAGASAAVIRAAVMELSDWLEARGIPTLWVAVHPLPVVGTYMWTQPQRQAFNTWLESGEVWGSTVNCSDAMSDPNAPDTMSPAYYWAVDIFGTKDGVHPNQEGYLAFGNCVAAAIPAALGEPG
ncbi:hypothetical protein BH10ACT3_BH10ACT3_13050 [soil metagenome]